jgi:hypothetical protein
MQTLSSGPRDGAHVVLLVDAPAIAVETRIGFASPGHGGAAAVSADFGMRYAFGRFRARGNHLLFFECRTAAAARHPGPLNWRPPPLWRYPANLTSVPAAQTLLR